MSEEMAEKVIFSITPDAIKPKGAATRRPSEKAITKDSTSNHEKPVPRYLRGPTSTCHDLCKHGIKHDDEVKKSNTFPPRTSGIKLKMKLVKNVNQEIMNDKEHKRITSLRDLPPEKIIHVPDSPSYIGAGSVDELSTLNFNSPICDKSRSSFHLSAKQTDKPSEVSSSVASIVPLAAVDITASEKHVSAELTDRLMDGSSMKSDATDPSNMDNEEVTPFNQIEGGSHIEPVCIKFMIPMQLPQATATPKDITNDQSEGSTADTIVAHSMEKCILHENSTSNGTQESSGAKINIKKNRIGSSAERMKLKNENNIECSTHRPVKQLGAKEVNSKVKPATCRNTPPIKAPAATCGNTPPEKLKTSSVTKRSTVAHAPTDRSEGLPRKQTEIKSLSQYDQQTKREINKVKISPSGRVKVKNQDNDIEEPNPFKENIGLQKVLKPVKQESDERNQQSKESRGLKRNKEKTVVAANKLIHGGDKALEPLGNIQSKKTRDSRVPSLKLRKERITNPPSAVKSQIKVGRLVSKKEIVPVGTPKVDRIDLKGEKEKLRKQNHIDEVDSQKELLERNPGEVTKSVSKMRHRQTPSSLVDNRTSTHRKLSSTRGKLVNLQSESNTPLRLKLMRARTVTGNHSAKGKARMKSSGNHIRSTTADLNPLPEVSKVVLRHQEVQDKKEAQGLFNNVIEETASKLVETRKSKVKALVGAFETVISLQESKVAPIGAVP